MTEILAVDAVDVTKRYGDLTAVDAITVQVAEGEVYGVLGPNGAGKTTFLRMLFGLIRPTPAPFGCSAGAGRKPAPPSSTGWLAS